MDLLRNRRLEGADGWKGRYSAAMMQALWKHPLVLLLTGLALGCAAHAVTSSVVVAAQSQPERGIFRECIAASFSGSSGLNTNQLSEGRLPSRPAQIPDGWHVVGASGTGYGNIVLCR